LIVLLAGMNWLSGCDSAKQSAARPALIVISGDTQGWIVPCGCTANQSGGLPRRATYLRQLRMSADVLYFDAGGAGAGESLYQKMKLEAIFDGETAMGICAHNLGGSELAMGPAALANLVDTTHIPLLSANAHLGSHAEIAPEIRIFQWQGKRLGVIGVVSPQFATAEIAVSDPHQAILDVIGRHRGEYDSLLILAYLPQEELERLAEMTPEADAVVGGPTGQSIVPRHVGPTLLASATNKGKFLVQLTPPTSAAITWDGAIVELGKSYGDDDGQVANLQAYLQRLKQQDLTAADSGYAPVLPVGAPSDYRIAGSTSCISCHAQSSNIWLHSLHAAAGRTLEARHFDVDPDCLRCHTTGYGLPGGFVSPRRTPLLYGVGCENCHGPSAAHVTNPIVHTQFHAFDQCVRCHDEENSPAFQLAAYWDKIRHGREATTSPSSQGAVN
jgi:hypothetical protein